MFLLLSGCRSFDPIFRGTLALIATMVLVGSTVCNTATAVDGYKDFKFGLSPEQVKKKCPTPLEALSNTGFAGTWGKDCRVLAADNFKMLDAEREVSFVFTKKGLAFIGFVLQPHEFPAVAKSLGEKYPGATLYPSPEEFQLIAKRFDAGQPNTTIKITYDGDTVVLLGNRDETGEATFLLTYIAADAAQQEISEQGKDDL